MDVVHGRTRLRDRAPAKPATHGAPAGPATRREPVRPAPRGEMYAVVRRDPVRARALCTLGLEPGADGESVKRAFRELARALHPDCYPGANAAERAELMRGFAEITVAYHALVA